jgi:hypothetical protein
MVGAKTLHVFCLTAVGQRSAGPCGGIQIIQDKEKHGKTAWKQWQQWHAVAAS